MSHPFFHHLNKFITVNEHDFNRIISFTEERSYSKKELLFQVGNRCNELYFVLKGCLHLYFIDENGVEKTVQFAIENWWITDFLAYHHERSTEFYLRAVIPTKVLVISREQQQALAEAFPPTERYFKNIYEIAYGAGQMRIKYLFNYSKEEVFFRFSEHYPEFVKRVPQYLLATFLGLTPEYLSELKKKRRL